MTARYGGPEAQAYKEQRDREAAERVRAAGPDVDAIRAAGPDVDAIAARAAAATPGPWTARATTPRFADGTTVCVVEPETTPGRYVSDTTSLEDAEFIAAAREDIPALLAALSEARERLRETCQILVEAVGADGPCDAEDAARSAVAALKEARAENEWLRRHVEDVTMLADVAMGRVPDVPWPKEEGDLMPRPLAFVCRLLMELLETTPGATNFVGWGWEDPKTAKRYNLVIQHAEGKAPQTVAAEAMAERDTALAFVRSVYGYLAIHGWDMAEADALLSGAKETPR